MSRRFAALFAFLVLVIAVLSVALWVLVGERGEEQGAQPAQQGTAPTEAPPEPEPELVLEPARFTEVPGWGEDDLADAAAALDASCRVFLRRSASAPIGPDGLAGTAGDWRPICHRLLRMGEEAPSDRLRALLETELRPWAVTDRGMDRTGLFTGYYEPELHGSRRRHGPYQTPLYREPQDLVQVDLGDFRDDLAGRRIAGRIVGDRLEPYHDREEIAGGALSGRGLELVWVDDPVDAFFLQIQGSGRVVLDDGTVLRVGYAGQNGQPYTAIGRELVARGELALEDVSLRTIRLWLETHPQQAAEVMARNASYVFFRRLRGLAADRGPLGSLGVPLTAGRSLAVDRSFLPLGAPLWLDGSMPSIPRSEIENQPPGGARASGALPLRRLVIAQDTGGAIRGPIRGDVFWGSGARAEAVAGHMRHPGRLWLLLPAAVDPLSR